MRIPTSMIVMGVLTAIPFGLAIKQTMGRGAEADRDLEDSLDPSLRSEREAAADSAAYEARAAKEQAEETLRKLELRAAQRKVIGRGPLALGPLFDGATLGAAVDSLETVRDRLANESEHHISVELEHDAKSLVGVVTSVGDDTGECVSFAEDLDAAWGKPRTDDRDRRVWVDGTRRGVFDVAHCKLYVELFADAAHWIGHGDAIVPLDSIGKPAKSLLAQQEVDSSEAMASWQRIGVGTGTGLTTLTAEIANGRVVALTASAPSDEVTRTEVTDQLTKLYGKPAGLPESGADLRWNGKPAVELTYTGKALELRVGK